MDSRSSRSIRLPRSSNRPGFLWNRVYGNEFGVRSRVAIVDPGPPQAIKSYLVLVRGDTPLEFECDLPLSRKKKETPVPALTHFRKIMGKNGFSLLEARIETGRRHQIRRHLARLGHQVVGDSTYGKGRINDSLRRDHGLPRLFLHAYLLDHPGGNASISEHRQIDPLPADLLVFLRLLFDEPQLLPGGFLEEAGETC